MGSVVRGAISSFKSGISVIANDYKADSNCDNGTEITQEVETSWCNFDVVMRALFQVVHLVKELRCPSD